VKFLRWSFLVLFAVLVFPGLIVASDLNRATPYSQLVPISPDELHRFLAKGKAQALDRTQRLAAMYRQPAAGQEDMDARYYRIELRIDEVAELVYGRVTMRARALVDGFSQPVLDFYSSMTVDSVYDSGVYTTSWTHASDLLTINLASSYDVDEEFAVTVVYHGHPTEGGFQGFYFGSHGGTPVISTLSEPYMARTWWPCKDRPDDKADSVDIIVEVNEDFLVSSNGTLRDSVDNGLTVTYSWHEQYPITTYLVSLAITDYSHFRRAYVYGPADADTMPVDFYPYPEKYWDAVASWPEAVDQIEFFAGVFGEYPFVEEKYGMTHFPWGGAMEHQTNTSATSGAFGFYRYLIAHELAHQWWGNYITCETWSHIWLNEGFASYCEALYAEHLGAWSALHSYMSGMQYWRGGTIYIYDTSSIGAIFSSRVYDKGAWVLHMLRRHVGHQTFFDILRAYYSDPALAHAHASTEDFRDVCESVSGQDLHEFFQDWIYGEYYPKYNYSWLTEPGASGEYNVFLHIYQNQTTNPTVFDMPIDIGLQRFSGVVDTARVYNNKRSQNFMFTIADDQPPQSVIIDPGNWILNTDNPVAYTFHIINDTLADGAQYFAYEDSVIAKGGVEPYEFAITSGSLPAGLQLGQVTGKITGTPTAAGTFTFTVRADGGYSDTRTYDLEIAETQYVPGDLDLSGEVQPPDVVLMVNYVYMSLAPPLIMNSADVNGDCAVNPLDVVWLVNYVYREIGTLVPGCVD